MSLVLVTGACGRLGRVLVPQLLKQGYSVRLLDMPGMASRARELFGAADFFGFDLASVNQEALTQICAECEAIIHLAGLVDYSASEKTLVTANALSTRRLAEAAKTAGVKRFVLISSTAIYAKSADLPITESSAPCPASAYGKSKLLAEEFLRNSGMPFVILRPTIIYGPEFLDGFSFVAKAISAGKMRLIGNGSNRVPFVHADDVVQAILLALKSPKLNEAYNLSSSELLTQKEAFGLVALSLGASAPHKSISKFLALLFASNTMKEYVRVLSQDRVFSIEKAGRELGFVPVKQLRIELKELAPLLLK